MHFHWTRADAVYRSTSGRDRHALRNLNPLADTLVMRDHEISAAAYPKLAHNTGVRPLHYLHDFAVCPPVALQTLDADRHAVAVHGAIGVFLAQVDIAL